MATNDLKNDPEPFTGASGGSASVCTSGITLGSAKVGDVLDERATKAIPSAANPVTSQVQRQETLEDTNPATSAAPPNVPTLNRA